MTTEKEIEKLAEKQYAEELKKYAELYVSCCTDFLLGEITGSHFINMMELFTNNLKKLKS